MGWFTMWRLEFLVTKPWLNKMCEHVMRFSRLLSGHWKHPRNWEDRPHQSERTRTQEKNSLRQMTEDFMKNDSTLIHAWDYSLDVLQDVWIRRHEKLFMLSLKTQTRLHGVSDWAQTQTDCSVLVPLHPFPLGSECGGPPTAAAGWKPRIYRALLSQRLPKFMNLPWFPPWQSYGLQNLVGGFVTSHSTQAIYLPHILYSWISLG